MLLNVPLNQFIIFMQTQRIAVKNSAFTHILDKSNLNIVSLNAKMDFMETLQQKNAKLAELNV